MRKIKKQIYYYKDCKLNYCFENLLKMAFVFKNNKEIVKPNQKEYNVCLSQKIYRIKKDDLKKNKTKRIRMLNGSIIKPPILRKQSAFGSDKKRDFLFLKLNQCSPGPGSYELSDNLIKKSFNINITSMGSDDYNKNHSNIYGFDYQNKPKLFISKEERFKKIKEDNNPGPGNYELTKFPKNEREVSNKMFGLKKSRSYLSNSPKRNISIPSKGNNFGYKFDEKGELILEEDSNLLRNNGKDIVGPGSYDINLPKIQKGILDWSKTSTDNKNKKGRNKIKEEVFNNIEMIMDDTNNNENNKYNLFNNSKTETETENNNNDQSQNLNYKDKGINVNTTQKNENFKKNIKEIKIKINESNYEKNNKSNIIFNIDDIDYLSNPEHFNYNYLRMLYDKYYYKQILNKYSLNKSQSPGPGSYYFTDEFENIANYSKSDNFGSSSSRGLLYEKKENKILIGNKLNTNREREKDKKLKINYSFDKNKSKRNYIKNDCGEILDLNKKIIKNKCVKILKQNINLNKYKDIFNKLNTEEKRKINDEYITKIKDNDKEKEKDKNHDNNGKKIINKSSSKIEKFGSLEKRFLEASPVNATPGVGTYSLIKSYKNYRDKYKSNSPYNAIIQKLNRVNGISDELKNKIYKLNHKTPPIGLYSPELKNCIEYDSAKKSQQNTEKKIGFLSEEKRFFILDNQKDVYNDVGKYNLTRDEKEINQQKVPFAFGEDRNYKINIFNYNMGNYNNNKIGPGVYRYDSYFDWHKKSFNKNFI